jgi:hypothetical protein
VTRRVLDLAGTNSYVEFPAHAFTNLTSATVEGWMLWRRFDSYTRFFDFGGTEHSMSVSHSKELPDLEFDLRASDRIRTNKLNPPLIATNVLQANQWCHIAAVSGPGGLKLYLNGALVAKDKYTGSFSRMEPIAHNYLGRKNRFSSPLNLNTDGQMAEVRVWGGERTEDQIRDDMLKQLKGNEEGLVSLWNFETVTNGAVKDAGPGGFDGTLAGQASIVEGRLPVTAVTVAGARAPQLTRTNMVLSLDGEGSYVELPAGSFTNLTEATVEGWVKWQGLRRWSRFFDFGDTWHAVFVANQESTTTLNFAIDRPPYTYESAARLTAPGLIKSNEWCHVAATMGSQGARLYFNGRQVSRNAFTGSFA